MSLAFLELLEKADPSKLQAEARSQIVQFHRLRNDLYHGDHGKTAERDKVLFYAGLARALMKNLFDVEVPGVDLVDEFVEAYEAMNRSFSRFITLERNLDPFREKPPGLGGRYLGILRKSGELDKETMYGLDGLIKIQHQLLVERSLKSLRKQLTPKVLITVRRLQEHFDQRAEQLHRSQGGNGTH